MPRAHASDASPGSRSGRSVPHTTTQAVQLLFLEARTESAGSISAAWAALTIQRSLAAVLLVRLSVSRGVIVTCLGLQAGAVHRVESLEAELEDAVPKREYQLLAKVSALPLDTTRGPEHSNSWEEGMYESGAAHAHRGDRPGA